MTTAKTAAAAPRRESANPFGDPWNPRGTAASDLRTTLLVGAFLIAVGLFAWAATSWVSDLSSGPSTQRGDAASLPKAHVASAASADTGAGVPVLAPRNLTTRQSAEFAARFRATPDGYFARISFERYDVVIHGAKGASAAASSARISETETGLAAMFSRDGADYQVEFACRGPGDEAGVSCLTEAEARAFVADLVATSVGGP